MPMVTVNCPTHLTASWEAVTEGIHKSRKPLDGTDPVSFSSSTARQMAAWGANGG